jgi:hypothetical protein
MCHIDPSKLYYLCSMLVLRQVLMSENSRATPLELENVISELVKALADILYSSPDSGTEEIVQAMVNASASVGSPSERRFRPGCR